jgi:hypothetical protein
MVSCDGQALKRFKRISATAVGRSRLKPWVSLPCVIRRDDVLAVFSFAFSAVRDHDQGGKRQTPRERHIELSQWPPFRCERLLESSSIDGSGTA